MDIFNILLFTAVGFFAQLIDGALGMAYGVSSTSFLLSLGIPPANASAAVHTAEIFTSGASGISHYKQGNLNKKLIKKLIPAGVVGSILGVLAITSFQNSLVKPFVAVYLFVMGAIILYKAFKRIQTKEITTKIKRLAIIGGFFDAVGGGGWGPIVTSTLIARGNHPRYTIGSVNLAEFFVTIVQVGLFLAILGLVHLEVIIGLIVGGVIAAPFGAIVCRKISHKALMVIVGILIMALSIRTIVMVIL